MDRQDPSASHSLRRDLQPQTAVACNHSGVRSRARPIGETYSTDTSFEIGASGRCSLVSKQVVVPVTLFGDVAQKKSRLPKAPVASDSIDRSISVSLRGPVHAE